MNSSSRDHEHTASIALDDAGSGAMTVDLSKIRPGDEVQLRATIKEPPNRHDGQCLFHWVGRPGATFFGEPQDIVSHTPKALAVGDRVRLANGADPIGFIVATTKGHAWVKWPYVDGPLTEPLAKLERIP